MSLFILISLKRERNSWNFTLSFSTLSISIDETSLLNSSQLRPSSTIMLYKIIHVVIIIVSLYVTMNKRNNTLNKIREKTRRLQHIDIAVGALHSDYACQIQRS